MKLCRTNKLSHKRILVFVLVLVLVLEVVEPLSLIEDEYDDEDDSNTLVRVKIDVVSQERGLQLKDGRSDQRKETNERRTSNAQHQTSNKVFCLF